MTSFFFALKPVLCLNDYMKYIFIIMVIALFLYRENSILSVSRYTIKSSKLKKKTVIAQISDFHNTRKSSLKQKLWKQIRDEDPDLICITGDLIDSRRTNIQIAVDFANQLAEIAPVYYVTGNHEIRSKRYREIMDAFGRTPMTILEDEAYIIDDINLIGLNDFYFVPSKQREERFTEIYQSLKKDDMFNMVMFHRPELFKAYCENEADLVICGHCHGGQFRLPFMGPVYAPNQGFQPQYAEGLHQNGNTSLIVSRGIGNSLFPFRLNNHPELVIITLEPENDVEL